MVRVILCLLALFMYLNPCFSQKIIGKYKKDVSDDKLIMKKNTIIYEDSVIHSESKNLVFENAVIKQATLQENTIILVGNYSDDNKKKLALIGLDNLSLEEKWQYVADKVSSVYIESDFRKKMRLKPDTVNGIIVKSKITVEEEVVNLTNKKMYKPEGCKITHEMRLQDQLIVGGYCNNVEDSSFFIAGLEPEMLTQKWQYNSQKKNSRCKGLLQYNGKLYALSRQHDSMKVYSFSGGQLMKHNRLQFVKENNSFKDRLLGKDPIKLKLDIEREEKKFRFKLGKIDIGVLEPYNSLELDNFYNIEKLKCKFITIEDTVKNEKNKGLSIKTKQMNIKDPWKVVIEYKNGNTFTKSISEDVLKKYARFKITLKDNPKYIYVHSPNNKGFYYRYLKEDYKNYELE